MLYRGINIDLNAVMRQKYEAYETAFAVGTKLTFPAPTACSTSDVVASRFMIEAEGDANSIDELKAAVAAIDQDKLKALAQ